MEEAAAVRRAALDTVEDVEPAPLRQRIERQLDAGSMVPGVLTILAVRALPDRPAPDPAAGGLDDPVARRAAGVQLVYDGLALTRELCHDEPWRNGDAGDAADADLAILAADVLVARGFHRLARTEASDAAVEVVRAFGRDQTVQRDAEDSTLSGGLEADVLQLAVTAGSTIGGGSVPPRLREFATELLEGRAVERPGAPFPDAARFFPETVSESLGAIATDGGESDGVATPGDR